MSETNKHPVGQPPPKIIFMHFEGLEINLAVAITGSEIAVLIWRAMAMGCFKGCDNVLLYDFEELERIDKGLAPFTSWEDVWLVGFNSGSSS